MNPITALYIAGGGGIARAILLGGGPNKSIGAAIKSIRQQFSSSIPSGRAGYEMARNVVRRVQTQIRAAERTAQNPDARPSRLPRDPNIYARPDVRYSYRVAVEFQSQKTGRKYRTVTTVVSNESLTPTQIINAAENQVREDTNYKDTRNRKQVKTLRGYDRINAEIIMAGRK